MKLPAIWTFGLALLLLVPWLTDLVTAKDTNALSVEKPIELLGEGCLDDWTWFTKSEGVEKQDVWSYENGILRCKGMPRGYLQTKASYKDYVLELEWRWSGKEGGNSGVLIHASTPMALGVWPKSLEVQLRSGDAGDFWVIGDGVDVNVENKKERRKDRRTPNLSDDDEKSIGEWNHMRIICLGGEVVVFVNNEKVNHGTELTIAEGAVCVQSEGTPIEFRNIRLSPVKK